MSDELPPPAVILHVTRGEEMSHTYEQAVWGYGDHELFTANQVRAAIAADRKARAEETMRLAQALVEATVRESWGDQADAVQDKLKAATDAARAALQRYLMGDEALE